jgi:hypothetical protein
MLALLVYVTKSGERGNTDMQDRNSDPKMPRIQGHTAEADQAQEKQLWHAPVLQRLDVSLLTATHFARKKGPDGTGSLRS